MDPMPVCDALSAWKNYEGKTAAIVGRYSFRSTGRWLDQESCDGNSHRGIILLAVDPKSAPRPPDTFQIDEPALEHKISLIKQHTALGKFRFGSADYDRWAVVFGRLENRNQTETQLVYRGDGAVIFFVDK